MLKNKPLCHGWAPLFVFGKLLIAVGIMRKFQYQTNPVIHQSTSRPPLKKFANRERTQSDSCMALYTVTWKPRAHVLPLTMLASITYILLREILDYIRLRIEVNIWARIPFPRSGQGSTNYSLSRFRPKGIRRARSPAQTYTFYFFFPLASCAIR